MFKAIKLQTGDTEQFKTTTNYITGLDKINIFIGLNNSGKSRLIRAIFADINKTGYDEYTLINLKLAYKEIIGEVENKYDSNYQNFSRYNIIFIKNDEIKQKLNDFRADEYFNFVALEYLVNFFSEISQKDFNIQHERNEEIILKYKNISEYIYTKLQEYPRQQATYNRLYIPILRGFRPLQIEGKKFTNEDCYSKRTIHDYFQNNSINQNEVYTGMNIYEDVVKLLLGTEEERQVIAAFEEFLSENIFNNKVTLIPKYNDNVLHIKIGNEPQLEIYNLGDGLQTLIGILFPIFRDRDKENIIFIEEPEAHLHPEWQTLLLNALKKFDKNQYFISTHSANFINNETSTIYFVEKKDQKSWIKRIDIEAQKVEILRSLGYKASDLFQTNYILWVEGASDKIYFNYWLKKMDPTLKEGQHYSIMFYGGPNFKHFLYYKDKEFDLTFLKTLNQNFGIYIDSDRKNQSEPIHEKKQAIEQSFTQNGLFCWLTEYREIENYIPFETFEKAVKKVNKKLNININADNYGDRGTVEDKDAQLSYSSKIQIPQSIFSKIQKNKDGTLKGVSDEDLRNEIEKAIQSTKSNTFGISKTTVAEEVVQNQPEIIGDELMNKLNDLIIRIKKANNKT